MLLWIAVASALLISFVEAATVTSNNVLAEQFCAKFPALHMCRLREELVGSMVELQFLLQENDVSQGDVALPMADVQKRKSAFVRFGKRSPADGSDVEKRKSAFVRFGRSVPEEQTLDKQ